MPFDKQEGGEGKNGEGSEVKFVSLDENYNHRLHNTFSFLQKENLC